MARHASNFPEIIAALEVMRQREAVVTEAEMLMDHAVMCAGETR